MSDKKKLYILKYGPLMVTYNKDTGKFYSKNEPNKELGYVHSSGYVIISLRNYIQVKAHILAYILVNDAWPEKNIDHINRVKHDNRWCNIRLATQSENMQNTNLKPGRTGYVGVASCYGGFRAYINKNGIRHHLGVFNTAMAANSAREAAKITMHTFLKVGV